MTLDSAVFRFAGVMVLASLADHFAGREPAHRVA